MTQIQKEYNFFFKLSDLITAGPKDTLLSDAMYNLKHGATKQRY